MRGAAAATWEEPLVVGPWVRPDPEDTTEVDVVDADTGDEPVDAAASPGAESEDHGGDDPGDPAEHEVEEDDLDFASEEEQLERPFIDEGQDGAGEEEDDG